MSRIRIYGRPGCTHCAHALAFFNEHSLEFEPHDLSRERITKSILESAIDDGNIDEVIDRQSPFYTLFGLDRKPPSRKKLIKLILEEPGLMRAPLVIGERGATFGWSADRFRELFLPSPDAGGRADSLRSTSE